ncbi:hypothetical protein GFI45_12265 [Salmonella enterica subsp. enterica]|nr:hypothetical protein [Salmonella enterica subsp. enterica serovar Vitkin]
MPLPLREYYQIERAAELLECTVGDLTHWASTGCIRLFIKTNKSIGFVITSCIFTHPPRNADFGIIISGTEHENKLNYFLEKSQSKNLRLYEFLRKRNDILYNAMIDYESKFGSINNFENSNVVKFFATSNILFRGGIVENLSSVTKKIFSNPEIVDGVDLSMLSDAVVFVDTSGYFALGEIFFVSGEVNNKFKKGINNCNPVCMPESNLPIYLLFDDNIDFDISNLFVSKADFCLISNASKNADDLPIKYPSYRNYGKPSNNISARIDGVDINKLRKNIKPYVAEMHATKRESVLKAAICMKKNHPEQCKTYSSWADAIVDHAHKFWPDGECPLTKKVIAEMLGKAEKYPGK